jgi:ribosomal protein L37AE/L43A
MDGIALLRKGQAAGLTIMADGDRLVIRGPRSARAMAHKLLAHKPAVLAALARQSLPRRAGGVLRGGLSARAPAAGFGVEDGAVDWGEAVNVDKLEPCPQCGSLELWQTLAGTWRCQHCDREALERSRKLGERAARLRAGERLFPLRRQRQPVLARETPPTTPEHDGEKVRPEVQGTFFEGISSRPKQRGRQR